MTAPAPAPLPDRATALALMHEYTASDSLRKHMLAVEAAMRAYAVRFGEDPERWALAGLMHDFDYERFPNAAHSPTEEHPAEGVRILRERGFPEDVLQAILGHASYTGVALASTQIYVIDADSDVWALDLRTGASNWKQEGLKYRWLGEASTMGDAVVVGDMEGWVHWLAASDGKFAARVRLSKHAIQAAPLVVGDTVYVEDIDELAERLESHGGTGRTRRPIDITSGPNAGARSIYLLDPDGYCVELFQKSSAAAQQ